MKDRPPKAPRAWNSTLPRATKPIARSGIRIARSALPNRSSPLPRVNKKRRASAFAHAYHSKARVRFVKALPCAACSLGPCENAHIEVAGMGLKAHYTKIIPLCAPGASVEGFPRGCHRRQTSMGWAAIGMTLTGRERAAAHTEALWLAHQSRGTDDAP